MNDFFHSKLMAESLSIGKPSINFCRKDSLIGTYRRTILNASLTVKLIKTNKLRGYYSGFDAGFNWAISYDCKSAD